MNLDTLVFMAKVKAADSRKQGNMLMNLMTDFFMPMTDTMSVDGLLEAESLFRKAVEGVVESPKVCKHRLDILKQLLHFIKAETDHRRQHQLTDTEHLGAPPAAKAAIFGDNRLSDLN